MSYNGSGTFQINTSGQPVVAGTVISSTAFNALTADLATGLSTAITKDGQTTTTARIPFAAGINSSLTTDSTSTSTGSIITSGGVGIAKALNVGTNANIAGTLDVTGAVTVTNPVINNIKMGYTTTATAAGTTTLTVASNYRQFFTGSTTQTIVLPVTSTLVNGMAYEIENNSTGLLTVNSSGGNLVGTIPSGVCAHAVCIGTTLTTAADWDWDYISTSTITGTGANVLATSPTITTPTISQLSSAAATNLTLQSAGTTAITIDTSQNVGIGTTSPLSKLSVGTASYNTSASVAQVNGASIATSNAAGIFNIGSTDSSAANVGGSLGFTANGAVSGYPSGQISGRRESATGSNYSSYLAFTTSNSGGTLAEKMRISSAGDLLLGNTSTNPVNDRVNSTAFSLISTSVNMIARAAAAQIVIGYAGNAGANINFYTDNGSTAVAAGTISSTANTTAYGTGSDYRLKNNVQPMTNALAKIQLLKPCTWIWKEGNYHGEGFIAHELQEVISSAVFGEKDAIDEDKNPKYQQVDTSFLVATLTAAIQEQQALIQSLTTRIVVLESK